MSLTTCNHSKLANSLSSKFYNNWLLPSLKTFLHEFLHTCNWLSRRAPSLGPKPFTVIRRVYTYEAQCPNLQGLHYLSASVELESSVQPSKALQTLTARYVHHIMCNVHYIDPIV